MLPSIIGFSLLILSSLALLPLSDSNPTMTGLCSISNGSSTLKCAGLHDTFKITGGTGINVLINTVTKTLTIVSKAINGTQPMSITCPVNQFVSAYNNGTRQFTCTIAPSASGGLPTLENIGSPATASVYAGNNTDTNFQFKRLLAGANISITN